MDLFFVLLFLGFSFLCYTLGYRWRKSEAGCIYAPQMFRSGIIALCMAFISALAWFIKESR